MNDPKSAARLIETDTFSSRPGGSGVDNLFSYNYGDSDIRIAEEVRNTDLELEEHEANELLRDRRASANNTTLQHPSLSGSYSDNLTGEMNGASSKGKKQSMRHEDDESDEDDGMDWEPPAPPSKDSPALNYRDSEEYNQSLLGNGKENSHFRQSDDREELKNAREAVTRQKHSISHSESRTRGRSPSSISKAEITRLWWRSALINVLFIGAWYIFSTLISIYNKWMFSKEHYNFPYPLFVTSIHMLVQWLLAFATLSVFPKLRPSNRPQSQDYVAKVVPCGMATGLDIGLSNLSLRTITLSFYTMCKSSSLAFVLLFAFLFRLERPSWKLAGIILVITGGVILMVSTETQFNLTGMMQVLSASALGGLRWSLTQMLLDKESMGMGNPIATLFWLAPIMGVTLATCSMIFDGWGNVFGSSFFETFWGSMWTMLTIFFPGILAFLMNVTEFGLIQRTSVVTLSVAGIFKEVAVIFLSMFIFHDQLTPINVSGLCVTIFGIALYNYLKYTQFTSGDLKGHGSGGHGGHGDLHGGRHNSIHANIDADHATFSPLAGEVYDLGDSDEEVPLTPRGRKTSTSSRGMQEDGSSFLDASGEGYRKRGDVDETGGPYSSSSHSLTSDDLNLRRMSKQGKAKERASERVDGLEDRMHHDQALIELKGREKAASDALERGISEHREADDWGFMSNDDIDKESK